MRAAWLAVLVASATVVGSLGLGSPASAASSRCDATQTGYDEVYCVNKVYHQADEDLNKTYQQLRARLNVDGRDTLKTRQLAWIADRDQTCSRTGAAGTTLELSCATGKTIKRTRFLQDRYRECISSGCLNSRLDP